MLIKLNLQRDNCALCLKVYVQILSFQLFTKMCGKADFCLVGFFKITYSQAKSCNVCQHTEGSNHTS